MKLVKWEDEHGWKHRSLIRDDMDDDLAYQGLPQDPPDLTELDCEQLLKNLHNLLVDRNLIDMKDIKGNELRNAVEIAFFRPVFELYRNKKLIGGTNG